MFCDGNGLSASATPSFMEKLIFTNGRKSQKLHTPFDITHTHSMMVMLRQVSFSCSLFSCCPQGGGGNDGGVDQTKARGIV